ncbi:MAG TPA: GAF domain-containing protein [Gemmatimonadales bacterium]|nr:GAF domain-containing protein [Gemmatimonadales bacterium]
MSEQALPIPVPLLRLDGDTARDPAALATWHEALSDALRSDLPHDLLALWLYTPAGEPVLLGPEALAQDNLDVPTAAPRVDLEQLARIELVVRRAYASVATMPVPQGDRDVGLLLVADLRPDVYGEAELGLLHHVATAIGPTMGRLARPEEIRRRSGVDDGLAEALRTLAEAGRTDPPPRAYTQLVSRAIGEVVPHERLELLVPDGAGEQCYRLGRHKRGPIWSDPALVVGWSRARIERLLEGDDVFAVGDARRDERIDPKVLEALSDGAPPPRSLAGARLGSAEQPIGYLVLGAGPADAFAPGALERLRPLAGAVASRVEVFLLRWRHEVLRAHVGVLRSVPSHLGKISEILATTARLGEATRLVMQEAQALIPFERLEFSLRSGEPDTVSLLTPGATLPLADLPRVPLRNTPVGKVIRGEAPHLLTGEPGVRALRSMLVVPLRVAGRVIGAMTLAASGPGAFNPADVALAQQLADAMAPHFELLRRSAAPVPPATAWRRLPK